MTISDKIRYHRKMLGLTQTEFGERLGVKKNAVSKWETGRVEDIPASKIKMMADLFQVPPSYLIDDESRFTVENELIQIVKQIPEEQQKLILQLVKGMINK